MAIDFETHMIKRGDVIENAAYHLAAALVAMDHDFPEQELEWDMNYIGEIVDAAKEILAKKGLHTCRPFYSGGEETPCYLTDECSNPKCPLKKPLRKEIKTMENHNTLVVFVFETGDSSCPFWREIAVVTDPKFDYNTLCDSISSFAETEKSEDLEHEDFVAEVLNASGWSWEFPKNGIPACPNGIVFI